MNNQTHYDSVTDAWTLILGENLHYGYFARGEETLAEATVALVDVLASFAPMDSSTVVLDVGCGIGGPAFRLSQRTGCAISGISISGRGIELARETCRLKGLSHRITFHQADALDSGFPDGSFDVVWVMESSHLMRDKERLLAENHRVLRTGGALLLCDLVLKREVSVADVYRLRNDLKVLERSFGKARMETLDTYESALGALGFGEIERRDISREVLPTLDRWKENVERNRAELSAHLAGEDIENFVRSCDILKELFAGELLGYGIVTGVRGGP
jgi:cyclopropane fatty-acyl-phospholipid synthase-like methyltransferase